MITVLGAGNGGQALSVHFESKGYPVKLWNRSEERIRGIIENGNVISVESHMDNRKFEIGISEVTTDIGAALADSRYVFIVTPGTAHRDLAHTVAPHVSEKQVFFLVPGRTFGSIEFINELGRYGKPLTVCFEAQTIPHACRVHNGILQIFGEKKKVLFSKNNGLNDRSIIEELKTLLPTFEYCPDYLGITLNNIGALVHPTPTILNAGRIEYGEKFYYYTQGITKTIAAYIQKIDDERQVLCRRLGCMYISLNEWLLQEYGVEKENIYESLKAVDAYQQIPAPDTLFHRYVFDDISTGLVPVFTLGKALGIEMPATEALIRFASQLVDYDFLSMGRKICREDVEKCVSLR